MIAWFQDQISATIPIDDFERIGKRLKRILGESTFILFCKISNTNTYNELCYLYIALLEIQAKAKLLL